MIRFLIVDDHPLFREALQSAIQLAYPDAGTTEATSIGEAVETLDANPDFDLALLDLTMPDTKGFEGLLQLRTKYPRLPIVIVSGLENPSVVREALAYGVAGFIPKSSRKAELAEAIREIINGAIWLPREMRAAANLKVDPAREDLVRRLASLTPQQLRVLQMLRQGKLNKQIAYELDVGETTVKAHVSEILRKLNVFSRTQAVIEVSKIDFDTILVGDAAGVKAQ
ncbi:MAG: response regulator transcription factor [Hyphomicrobiaceae bacterium]|nr:response regulator transcription factor [Hyphomicrobiaceae bacterium]